MQTTISSTLCPVNMCQYIAAEWELDLVPNLRGCQYIAELLQSLNNHSTAQCSLRKWSSHPLPGSPYITTQAERWLAEALRFRERGDCTTQHCIANTYAVRARDLTDGGRCPCPVISSADHCRAIAGISHSVQKRAVDMVDGKYSSNLRRMSSIDKCDCHSEQ